MAPPSVVLGVAGEASPDPEPCVDSPDSGALSGGWSPEPPLALLDPLVAGAVDRLLEPVPLVCAVAWPEKALAASPVKTPVKAALPAISQRLAAFSLASAASRVRGVCPCMSQSPSCGRC